MKKYISLAAAGALAFGLAAETTFADGDFSIDVDVTGWVEGDSIKLDLGDWAEVTGIGWQVTLFADASDGSWLSDGRFEFAPQGEPIEVVLTPGAGDNFAGKEKYEGFAKLADVGLPNIKLDDGVLEITYNAFGWSTWVQDGDPFSSFLTIQYNAILPAPGALALLGLAGLVGASRRRK